MVLIVRLDSALRLVFPLRVGEDGSVLVQGYHTPISTETFEANYRMLAATKAAIFGQGPRYAYEVGAAIAALRLRDEARRDALERGDVTPEGIPVTAGADALLADMRRLTAVAVPGAGGWETVPVDLAIKRQHIDAEDWREAESGLVFFSCVYFMTRRAQRATIASLVASVMQGSTTSLSLTEWTASLPTSMPAGPSLVAAD